MSYKVLYRKYRPDSFDSVVGQDYTVRMLKNAVSTEKNAHAYIFTGPRGTGKTSSAKVFAKALNCECSVDGNPCNTCDSCLHFKTSSDIIEIDAASNNGVDEIRELINNVKLVPSSSKFKVYIIDEVHMLTASAFNALLLTLEEPPSHVVFILATTDIQNVPITILSRCQRFDFKPINKQDLEKRLRYVASEESISITDQAIEEIALISAGGMRDALGMLDQLASNGTEITLDAVSSYFGSVSTQKIDKLLTNIENKNTESMLEVLENIKSSGTNYSVFVEKLINELRKCAVHLKSGKAKYRFGFDTLYHMIFDLNECLCNININVNPYVLIELVLLKYIDIEETMEVQMPLGNNNKIKEYNPGNDYNTLESLENKKEKKIDASRIVSFSVETRINNCFCEASKEYKNKLVDLWVAFMNFLMTKDRSFVSLMADTSVCAASPTYAIITSRIFSTNNLINVEIMKIESYFKEFSGLDYKFVSLAENDWKEAMNKYKVNIKNGKIYTFIEEKIENNAILNTEDSSVESGSIEDVAKDIFGTFEIES